MTDEGFTLVELLVALLVLAIILTSVAYTLASAFTNTGLSRQMQTANAMANKAIEEVRGLPLDSLLAGLNVAPGGDTTIAGDTNISTTTNSSGATIYIFNPTGEQIVTSSWKTAATIPPFSPHISGPTTVNGTKYWVATYPTIYKGVAGEYRITTIVSWSPPDVAGATSKVSEQTVIFSPANGCLSPNTHPYAAPCQPYFQASATLGKGYFEISPAPNSTDPAINGLQLTNAELFLPQTTSNIDSEQISTILGGTTTTGGTISAQSASEMSTGDNTGTVQADSDPGSGSSPAAYTNIGQVPNTSVTMSSGGSNGNSLTITPSAGDSGSAVATAAAGSAQASDSSVPACLDLNGAAQSTNLPCGDATTVQYGPGQTGTLSAQLGLYAGSESLQPAPLVTVNAPPNNSTITSGTFVGRYGTTGTTYCPGASGDGCVHAGAQRQIGQVTAGGLPPQVITDGAAPAFSTNNWLFSLSNYSDRVSSESGIGTTSPAYQTSLLTTPTFTYFNGSSFKTLSSWPSSATTLTISPFTITDPNVQAQALTITISGSLTVGGTSTTSTGSSPCATTCSLSAAVSSPVKGDIYYKVVWNNTVLANFDLHVDLGTLLATTTYQEAPSAG